MERGQVLVIGLAIAVVGGFVYKVLSDRTALPEDLGIERSFRSQSEKGTFGATGFDQPGSRSSGGGVGGSERSREGRSEKRRFGTAGAMRDRQAGLANGGRPGARGGSVATGRDSGGSAALDPGTAVDVPTSRAQRRADVMDNLSEPSRVSDPIVGTGDQEVALEVRSTDDSEQASRSEDIDDPGDGDGIKFTEGSQLTFAEAGGATGESGTISFDVEPEWKGGDATDNSLVQIRAENEWANRLQLVKNGRFLRFILADSTGREADISVPIDEWEPGQSHSVTASWGDGQTSLFIDGRLAGSNTYEGDFNIAPNTPLHLGSDYRSSDYGGANATIRGFTLYKNAQHP